MKKFAVKIIAVFAILLMSGQSVFASATNNADTSAKVHGVIVVTAQSQIYYVEAGRFFREYSSQLIKELTNVNLLIEQSSQMLEMIEVESVQYTIAYQVGKNGFATELSD